MSKSDSGLVVTIDDDDLATMDVRLDPEGEVRAGTAEKKVEAAPPPRKDKEDVDGRKDDDEAERVSPNADAMESLQKQLAQLQAERDAERAARQEAQRTVHAAVNVADTAKLNAFQSRYEMVTGHIASAESREALIKREIKAALEVGDAEKAAELQMEAAKVAARKIQHEDARADIEAAYAKYKSEREADATRQQESVQPRSSGDPFEDHIANLSEPSKQWLRQHRECVTDRATNAKVLWAHEEALKNGLRPDTPAYFDHLERKMGFRQDDDGDDDVSVTQSVRSSRVPAAPVSRHNSRPDPRTGAMGGNRYQLTPEEARMAETLGMTPTEYATHKIKAIKNGRYDNH